jgi:hypothetical protein
MSKNTMDWSPDMRDDGYIQWRIPSHCWSGEQYGEDMIKITYSVSDQEWWAVTEMDQNVKRDLDEDEVAQLREEFGLDRYLPGNPGMGR